MENVNLLNLPPSEKLVAILDGELNQQEAGNFFQELYQSQDLQDQFFDMINIKNNFRGGGGITPPDNLKSNILKGIGLAAASTITYQTVATNNAMSWGSAMIQTLGSKISIALMSALMASLVTIGVMKYNSNQERNLNNQKTEFAQNQFDNKINNQNSNNQTNQNQNIAILGSEQVNNEIENGNNSKFVNSKIPNSKISSTKTITKQINSNNINFKNTNNLNNNLDKKDNFETNNFSNNYSKNSLINSSNSNSNNIVINENEDSYDKNSLVPGKVPESKYKVEIISKNPSEFEVEKISELKNTTIKNDPNSDLDFYNPETTKSKYIEEESKMSFHFRNFSAKAVNDLDIPQMNNPIINNIGAGILYEMNDKWSVGVEIGQENFEQEFKAQNGTNEINLQQNHLAFWGGALVRYNFNNNKIKSEFNPYINMFVGSTDIGPLVKPSIGITYNISNDFAVFGAGEFTAMYSKYNSIWYNSQKYGFTYGFILKF